MVKKLYRSWDIDDFNIVHFNNTENFLNFKKNPHQISIAESHWYDIWVNYDRCLIWEKRIIIKFLWKLLDYIFWNTIRKKINEFDIYYCSTLDMLEPLKKNVRSDVKWLPNTINDKVFNSKWKTIKLKWNPACFFPNRLHWNKNPELAISIFKKYIKPTFPDATLHLLNQWFDVDKYKKDLTDSSTYFWHDFMDKETLAWKIRGADLCFWDFELWALTLMDMQIMACKKAIITYDKYEIVKIDIDKLLDLTKNILENKNFKEKYISKNYKYIMEFHTEEAVSKIHLNNLKPFFKKLNI